MQFLVIGSGHLNNISNKRHNFPDHPLFLGHVFLSRAVLISCSFFSCSFLFSSRYFKFSLSKFFSLILFPLIFVFSCLSTRISMFNIDNTFLLSWFSKFIVIPSSFHHYFNIRFLFRKPQIFPPLVSLPLVPLF